MNHVYIGFHECPLSLPIVGLVQQIIQDVAFLQEKHRKTYGLGIFEFTPLLGNTRTLSGRPIHHRIVVVWR